MIKMSNGKFENDIRIIEHQDMNGVYYSLQEVAYDDTGYPHKHTNNYQVQSDTIEGLEEQLDYAEEAFAKPVLRAGIDGGDNTAYWPPPPIMDVPDIVHQMIEEEADDKKLGGMIRRYYSGIEDGDQMELDFKPTEEDESVKTI